MPHCSNDFLPLVIKPSSARFNLPPMTKELQENEGTSTPPRTRRAVMGDVAGVAGVLATGGLIVGPMAITSLGDIPQKDIPQKDMSDNPSLGVAEASFTQPSPAHVTENSCVTAPENFGLVIPTALCSAATGAIVTAAGLHRPTRRAFLDLFRPESTGKDTSDPSPRQR